MRPTHPTAPHPGLDAWRRTRKLAYRILAVVSADPTKLLQNLPLLLPRRPSVTPKNLPEVLPFRSPTHPVTLPPPSSARVTFSNGATIPPPVTFSVARCGIWLFRRDRSIVSWRLDGFVRSSAFTR